MDKEFITLVIVVAVASILVRYAIKYAATSNTATQLFA